MYIGDALEIMKDALTLYEDEQAELEKIRNKR